MTEFTIAQFTASLSNGLTPISAKIARAFGFNGGGTIECWVIAEYLLSIPNQELVALDYRREYIAKTTSDATRFVDLAYNILAVTPNHPPILSEWKCQPIANDLAGGFFEDLAKFTEVLRTYPQELAKPYPFLVGIAPLMAGSNMGFGIQATNLGNGIGLYQSTQATWEAYDLDKYTAYSGPTPSIPEQAVMAGTLAASD